MVAAAGGLRSGRDHDKPRSETKAASPTRQGKAADLQLFEDVDHDTSFAGNKTGKAAPQPARPAGDVPPEPGTIGPLLIKPASTFVSFRNNYVLLLPGLNSL